MARIEVECPSGLVGVVRGLKGKELRLLGQQENTRTGETFEKLLKHCWVETTDAGIYEVQDDGSIDWKRALVGDRFYALMQIRMATFKEAYCFRVTCGQRGCQAPIDWEVDLSDLPVRALPDASREKLKRGDNVFETTLGNDSRKVKFRLLTGADERKAQRLAGGQDVDLVKLLSFRVVEIEGVDRSRIDDALDDSEADDLRLLMDAMQRVDCGVETGIEVRCTECGAVQGVELPFGREFFLPRVRSGSATGSQENSGQGGQATPAENSTLS